MTENCPGKTSAKDNCCYYRSVNFTISTTIPVPLAHSCRCDAVNRSHLVTLFCVGCVPISDEPTLKVLFFFPLHVKGKFIVCIDNKAFILFAEERCALCAWYKFSFINSVLGWWSVGAGEYVHVISREALIRIYITWIMGIFSVAIRWNPLL